MTRSFDALTAAMRLAPRSGEVIDRDRPLRFRWDGRDYTGFAGDTIVSALAAAGVTVFSRSFKYHRPRGVLTASYLDPGCTVQVGDEPNVRAAHRALTEGMDVRPQNAWPSLKYDVKAANQLVARFLTAGFYYKTFIKPQRLWPAYEAVLRRFSSGGVVSPEVEDGYHDKRYAHPDVLVAGGGPAGLAAALAAAAAGARVLLVEEEHQLGGHLRWGSAGDLTTLAALRARIAAEPAIEVLTNSVVTGRYDDNWIAVVQRDLPDMRERLIKARAQVLVVAQGLVERPYVFEGNDLPGVLLSTGVRRLVNLYAVRPGWRAVVFTANESGDAAADDLRRAGVDVVHVADARTGADVVRAYGRGRLRGVQLTTGRFDCDLLVTATGWTAPTTLLNMSGDHPRYQPHCARFVPDLSRLPDNVLPAGGISGDGTVDQLIEHGDAIGRIAAHRAEVFRIRVRAATPSAVIAEPDDEFAADIAAHDEEPPVLPTAQHPELFRGLTHGLVDFCEDVSSKDLLAAVAEGYDSAELAKRYTTSTMGPTQGKLEVVNTVAILADALGKTIAETGTTTWRPPYAPITLGALAGRSFEPIRRSPMQGWHEEHGVVPLIAGAWVRPDHYGDAATEALNVRRNVGVIDVTPIGKLDLRGADVPALLNLLYVNKWSQLGIGRVRYGVMCAEDGVVMDDGVTGRLGEHHYLMSTTSSGAVTVWEWIDNWLQTEHPEWRVHVTPVTTGYASMNVAGPRSRELLRRVVTGVDLSPDSFPYMNVRTGQVAGVDECVLWRIGFTGELSYELHVPAAYGLHVWQTLMTVGADLGIAPFGVEAQRILRLEKGHLIVGQDTDGLTRGYSAALDWAIKLGKDDFVGKPELLWQSEEADFPRLVGLRPTDDSVVPTEASQLVGPDGRIIGRITSSRMSPTLGRPICLAQVAQPFALPGTQVTIRLPNGQSVSAQVTQQLAQVDPTGERMRV